MSISRRIGLAASLAIGCCVTTTWAQDNPLDVTTPAGPAANQPAGAANPLDPAAPIVGGGGVYVPDFIKPGARIVYESGSATQGDLNKPGSAGVGLTRYDVIAVTPSKVYLRAGTYLQDPQGKGYTFAGSSNLAVGAFEVSSGGAIWIDRSILEGYQNTKDTTILDADWPIGGKTYKARSITRLTNASAMRQVFDRGTGLQLIQQLATGDRRDHNDPFMRTTTSSMQFQTYRIVDLGLDGAPAWSKNVRRMKYQGGQTLAGGVGPSITLPMECDIHFTERGDGWTLGQLTLRSQGQPDSTSEIAIGPATFGGNWLNPAALNQLQQGEIDRDATLRFALTYEIAQTPMGRLGVFKETGDSRTYQMIWAYDLNDGALVYTSFEQPEFGLKRELKLVGRE